MCPFRAGRGGTSYPLTVYLHQPTRCTCNELADAIAPIAVESHRFRCRPSCLATHLCLVTQLKFNHLPVPPLLPYRVLRCSYNQRAEPFAVVAALLSPVPPITTSTFLCMKHAVCRVCTLCRLPPSPSPFLLFLSQPRRPVSPLEPLDRRQCTLMHSAAPLPSQPILISPYTSPRPLLRCP